MDDLESHSGADTMPVNDVRLCCTTPKDALTVLVEDVETLLDQQRRVQHYQAIADGQHIVARPGLQKSTYSPLISCQRLYMLPVSPSCPTRPSICSLSSAESEGRARRFRGATKAEASSGAWFTAVSAPDIL